MPSDRNRLEHEWNDGFAAARIVFEVLFVSTVFAQSPNGHLVKAGKGEQSSWLKTHGYSRTKKERKRIQVK